jgi:heme/copper-type cytochrome/quinol oxidase subunit 2
MVALAFSSGYKNDAPNRRFLITVVVVIVVVIVVVVVVIVVIIVVIPPPTPRSRGNFHIKIPHRS